MVVLRIFENLKFYEDPSDKYREFKDKEREMRCGRKKETWP